MLCSIQNKFIRKTIQWSAVILMVFLLSSGLPAVDTEAAQDDVVAMVNEEPIYHDAFIDRLLKAFGQQTIEEMINEKLILQEAERQGIEVSQKEIDAEFAKIREQFITEEQWEEALASSGITAVDLRRQLEIELILYELLGDQLAVSESEINEMYEIYSEQYGDVDEDLLRAHIAEQILGEKFQEAVNNLLVELRQEAEIEVFLSN